MSIDEQIDATDSPPGDGEPADAHAPVATSDPFAIEGDPAEPSLGEPGPDTEAAPTPEPAPAPKAEPVQPTERVGSVDVLRGVALMGILAMNISGFAWPHSVYMDPTARPGANAIDIVLWALNHLIFDTKMMTLFSMLFGAGLVLMDDRIAAKGASLRGVYYRRNFWLLVIGLIHAYFIWYGDILVDYALCGFLLYLFRKKTPKTLIITGVILISLMAPLLYAGRAVYHYALRTATAVEKELSLDIPQTSFRLMVYDRMADGKKQQAKAAEAFKENIEIHRGSYPGIVANRAKELIWEQTLAFLFGATWMIGGRMLIGMGLMKLGVFSATRSWRCYAWMTILGYGIGLPLLAFDTYETIQYQWSMINYGIEGGMLLNMIGGVIVVMGHIGLVMMIYKGQLLQGLTRRLGAAGRMALSNYLFDSILCTTLFYGYGFGLYGKLDRAQLYLIVLAIWAFQLWFSPIWLSKFRYGPAEWLWRSLTYWKLQSMRPRSDNTPAPPPPPSDPEPQPIPAMI